MIQLLNLADDLMSLEEISALVVTAVATAREPAHWKSPAIRILGIKGLEVDEVPEMSEPDANPMLEAPLQGTSPRPATTELRSLQRMKQVVIAALRISPTKGPRSEVQAGATFATTGRLVEEGEVHRTEKTLIAFALATTHLRTKGDGSKTDHDFLLQVTPAMMHLRHRANKNPCHAQSSLHRYSIRSHRIAPLHAIRSPLLGPAHQSVPFREHKVSIGTLNATLIAGGDLHCPMLTGKTTGTHNRRFSPVVTAQASIVTHMAAMHLLMLLCGLQKLHHLPSLLQYPHSALSHEHKSRRDPRLVFRNHDFRKLPQQLLLPQEVRECQMVPQRSRSQI